MENLDGMSAEELVAFWVQHQGGRGARALFAAECGAPLAWRLAHSLTANGWHLEARPMTTVSLWYLRADESDGRGLRECVAMPLDKVTRPAIRRTVGALQAQAEAAPDYRPGSIPPDLGEAIDAAWLLDAAKRGTRASVESPRGWIVDIVADGGE